MQRRDRLLKYGPRRETRLHPDSSYVGTFIGTIEDVFREEREDHDKSVVFRFVAEERYSRVEVEYVEHDHPSDLAPLAQSLGVAPAGTEQWRGDIEEFQDLPVEFDVITHGGQLSVMPLSIKRPSLSWQEVDGTGGGPC